MNLKAVTIELSPLEVREILRIDLDEDADGAFRFVKENLGRQVKGLLQPH